MERSDSVYVRLQQHLDKQPVGFPATRSGAELRVLKHIFMPQEAEIACLLSYKLEPLTTIHRRSAHLAESPEELEESLKRIQRKGGVESRWIDGEIHYGNSPLVVGMYELQLNRLTPAFIKDFSDYTSDRNFGVEFLSTELPQMRTIPVSKSIRPQHHVSTFDEVTGLIQQAEEPFVILECICRKKRSIEEKICKATDRKETCLAMGGSAGMVLRAELGRAITRDEALSIIEQNQQQGLVLQPSNTEKPEFICSCCGCCCGMLRTHKKIPIPLEFWASNFYAVVDTSTCEACGACEAWCHTGAIRFSEGRQHAAVNLNRCIGCGVCVSSCPTEAISLLKKSTEVKPPSTREELYEIILAKKKGPWGKLKLQGKMVIDAVRTGETHLFKPRKEYHR